MRPLAAADGELVADPGEARERGRVLAGEPRRLPPGQGGLLEPLEPHVLLAELPIDLGRSALGAAAGALQVEPGRVQVLGAQAGQRQLRENAAVAFVQSVGLAEELERGARRSFPEQLAADPTHLLRDGAGLRGSRSDARGAPLQGGDSRLPVLAGEAAEQGRHEDEEGAGQLSALRERRRPPKTVHASRSTRLP